MTTSCSPAGISRSIRAVIVPSRIGSPSAMPMAKAPGQSSAAHTAGVVGSVSSTEEATTCLRPVTGPGKIRSPSSRSLPHT